jgi:hypothetical protein
LSEKIRADMWQKKFIRLSGNLLLITSVAKFISITGNSPILHNYDPLLLIKFDQVFFIVGLIEFGVAMVCCFSNKIELPVYLIAFLATDFAIYRTGLFLIHYQPCHCLGGLTDAVHETSPRISLSWKLCYTFRIMVA